MKAYGDKRTSGYGEITGKPNCRCCNGSYAKVGHASNRDNALRGLKKSARQDSKLETKQILEDNDFFEYDHERATEEYEHGIVEDYTQEILCNFMHSLRAIAPELGWADSEESWGHEPRGLSAIPYRFKFASPHSKEEWSDLIEKIIRERDAKHD